MIFRFLEIEPQPSHAVETLLKNNVIGTPGLSMLYRHLGVTKKLYRIPKPHVVSVKRNSQVVGVCIFCERTVNGITGFYVRYFAFRDNFRLKAIVEQRPRQKTSVIRAEIISLLQGNGLLADPAQPFFHYAYVDPRNPRSARLCEAFGFIPVRQYTTRLFSRLWPRQHPHLLVKEAPPTDAHIRAQLGSFYSGYNHVSFENLGKTYYYVEDETGAMVAGAHVQADAWKILTLPGANGRRLLKFFDRMPLLSRLLSKHFRFLAVEGVYCLPGKEYVFEQLLETLLHRHTLHTAIMVVDTDSTLYRLTQKLDLGLLAKISPRVYGHVIVHPENTGENFIEGQQARPAYISVHDVS